MSPSPPENVEEKKAVTADPQHVVKHSRFGIWDYWEDKDPDSGRIVVRGIFANTRETLASFPYLIRATNAILEIPGCKSQVALYSTANFLAAFVPAISVWLEGRVLFMMEAAMETGDVDPQYIILACAGRIACTLAHTALDRIQTRASDKVNARLIRMQAIQTFCMRAKLDLPTSERWDISQELSSRATSESLGASSVWTGIQTVFNTASTITHLCAQSYVLYDVLRGQTYGTTMTVLPLILEVVSILRTFLQAPFNMAYALSTQNKDYWKIEGWKRAVEGIRYRKEIVAGNLADLAISEYTSATEHLGDDYTSPHSVHTNRQLVSPWMFTITNGIFTHLPQIAFAVRAMHSRRHLAEFMASMHLVQSTTNGFSNSLRSLLWRGQQVKDTLDGLRRAYTSEEVANVVLDGTLSFPTAPTQVTTGISLEFRDVSFKYPGTEKYALREVSFTLLPGQLCVIVGSNGAGKSTILKLAVRLYDPDEGCIFINGHDIRTLKLHDLRNAVSVLFQDYNHFPFSIRDNIALGDPSRSVDDARVRRAARLGGADAFVESLENGYDSFLTHIPGYGTVSSTGVGRNGQGFDMAAVQAAAGLKSKMRVRLSGGQLQRLAVARTFMRTLAQEDGEDTGVGLLLFDEPSASLDPVAEHDLFDRLRQLRGSKTMVFSSHRFGKLTRHADLILYMDDSGVMESGMHEELLGREGDYARLWNIQAQAFVA